MNIVELFEKLSLETSDRLERAKSMGFDTSKIWYHATTVKANFSKFKVGKHGNDELGSGVYLATNPQQIDYWSRGDNGRMIPCYIRSGDVFDYSKLMDNQTNSQKKMVNELQRRYIGDPKYLKNRLDFCFNYRQSNLSDILRDSGYIGAINPHSQFPSQIVIFDPNNIRSIFAKFNPAKSESDNLLA